MQFTHTLLDLLKSFGKNSQIDLVHPMTLIRYIAREKGLAGSDNLEQAKIEEILETLAELENDGKSHMEFIAHMDKILFDMEKKLESNGGDFMVGHKMSMADMGVYVVLDQMTVRLRANYPYLSALYESIDISLYF